jgi:hypothetical protein
MQATKKIAVITMTGLVLTVGAGVAGNAATKTTVKKTVVRTSITKPAGFNKGGMIGGPQATLNTALKALVAKGTITQTQADAITAEVNAAEAAEHAARGIQKSATETLIASTLGIDLATLKSRLAAGESLATISGDKKDALIAALVAQENSEIDAAVSAGKLTSAQAATKKANVTQRVTDMVNNTRPKMGKGGHGGRGGHGPMGKGLAGTTNGIPSQSGTTTSN